MREALEVKVALGVVVTDVLDHLADEVHLGGGEFAVGKVAAEDVAEDPAEVLVARVADEAAGVGQHANEAAQQAERAERVHLLAHAVFLIQEPPSGAELHLAREGAVVEGVGHNGQKLVVLGIEAIEDSLGETVLGSQAAEELMSCGCQRQVVDGIESGVGAEELEHLLVVVADGAQVVLLRPALLGVHDGHVVKESAAVLVESPRTGGDAEQDFLEDHLDLHFLVVRGIEGLETVVGEFATHRSEEIVTLLERFDEVGVGVDLFAGSFAELDQILLVSLWILDGHSLVRTPCRDDLCTERMLGNLLVPAKVIRGVVGRAYDLDTELADESLAAVLIGCKFGVALLENLTCGLGAQELVDTEHAAEFQMGPVVKGITERVRYGLRPFLELLPGSMVAGNVLLRHAVAAHRAPFVMVSVVTIHQRELGDVAELDVFGYMLRKEMAVVVDDGHALGTPVIELPRKVVREHEIFVDKTHGRF